MPYAFYYDTPGDRDWYAKITAALGDDRPDGLMVHLVTEIDSGIRHYNVWRSPEQWQKFRDQHVGPTVAAVLAASGVPAPPGPPEEHELSLVDLEIAGA